ncbi:hypothetical protein [Odoribacter lunatus]|uniref:hypothetical protein n=1 Tax=Odoribacter lunatus TaxID=2941335 RepID=UPI0020423C68|nr:hypothetical protein [Odoribacter lunatus]
MLIAGMVVVLSCILGGVSVYVFLKIRSEKEEDVREPVWPMMFEPLLRVTPDDVERLTQIIFWDHLEVLMEQSKVEQKLPWFYNQCLDLRKSCREKYLDILFSLFTRDRKEWTDRLMKEYTEINPQDILMMLMVEAGYNNKSIARLLWINYETFKKRKSRLKAKCKSLNIPFEFKRANADGLPEPLAGE